RLQRCDPQLVAGDNDRGAQNREQSHAVAAEKERRKKQNTAPPGIGGVAPLCPLRWHSAEDERRRGPFELGDVSCPRRVRGPRRQVWCEQLVLIGPQAA